MQWASAAAAKASPSKLRSHCSGSAASRSACGCTCGMGEGCTCGSGPCPRPGSSQEKPLRGQGRATRCLFPSPAQVHPCSLLRQRPVGEAAGKRHRAARLRGVDAALRLLRVGADRIRDGDTAPPGAHRGRAYDALLPRLVGQPGHPDRGSWASEAKPWIVMPSPAGFANRTFAKSLQGRIHGARRRRHREPRLSRSSRALLAEQGASGLARAPAVRHHRPGSAISLGLEAPTLQPADDTPPSPG